MNQTSTFNYVQTMKSSRNQKHEGRSKKQTVRATPVFGPSWTSMLQHNRSF